MWWLQKSKHNTVWSPQEVLSFPFAVSPLPSPLTSGSAPFFVTIIWAFLRMSYVVLCVLLLFLKMILRFTHAIACVAQEYSIVIVTQFVLLPVDWHWVVSSLGLKWIKSLSTFKYKSLYRHVFSFYFDNYLWVGLLSSMISVYLTL